MLAKMQRGPQPYLLAQLQKAQEDELDLSGHSKSVMIR